MNAKFVQYPRKFRKSNDGFPIKERRPAPRRAALLRTAFFILALFAAAALIAVAATLPPLLVTDGVTGGGTAAASSTSLRLGGAIDGWGLPDGYAALSQGSGTRLEVGQIPALAVPIPTRNGADPAWLKLESSRQRSR